MPSWKKLASLVLLLAICTTSCWNRRELNELAIVAGVGIDPGPEPETINFTCQVFKPAKMKTTSEGTAGTMPYFNITGTGRTIFEAIRKNSRSIDRRLYFPHSQVIIINEEIAKRGVSQYLDLMVRDPEFRRDNFVLVSSQKTTEILSAKTELENVPGSGISHLVVRRKSASLATGLNLLEFMQRLMSKTTAPVASRLELNPETKKLTLTGTAVFKKDKLVGYLNEIETRGLLWSIGEVQAAVLVVKCPDGDGNVTLEVVSSAAQIEPQIKNDKLQLLIKVGVQVHLAEQSCPGDLTKPESSDFLKKELEQLIKKEITSALDKARELNSDVFGLGSEINKKYPRLWPEMEKEWDEQFSELDVVINVKPVLTRSGMTTKTARP